MVISLPFPVQFSSLKKKKKLGRKEELSTSPFIAFCVSFFCSYLLFEDVEKFPKGKAESDRNETYIRNK